MAQAPQPTLFDVPKVPAPGTPDGFVYRPDFLSRAEEADLAAWLGTLPFAAFQFRGFEGRRRVVSYGWKYDFTRSHLDEAGAIPAELLPVRARAAELAGHAPEELQQVLLNEYPPGAPIGWHRDRPIFSEVVGISLLAPCTLRLRRRLEGGGFERASVILEPRSAYLLSGPARTVWEHSIPPVEAHRYSITFRNFKA